MFPTGHEERCGIPMDCSPPGSSVYGIPKQDHWRGWPFPSPGDPPNPGVEPASLGSPALAGRFLLLHHLGSPRSDGPRIVTIDASVQSGGQQEQSGSETQWGSCFKPLYSRAKKHTLINYLVLFLSLSYVLDF